MPGSSAAPRSLLGGGPAAREICRNLPPVDETEHTAVSSPTLAVDLTGCSPPRPHLVVLTGPTAAGPRPCQAGPHRSGASTDLLASAAGENTGTGVALAGLVEPAPVAGAPLERLSVPPTLISDRARAAQDSCRQPGQPHPTGQHRCPQFARSVRHAGQTPRAPVRAPRQRQHPKPGRRPPHGPQETAGRQHAPGGSISPAALRSSVRRPPGLWHRSRAPAASSEPGRQLSCPFESDSSVPLLTQSPLF